MVDSDTLRIPQLRREEMLREWRDTARMPAITQAELVRAASTVSGDERARREWNRPAAIALPLLGVMVAPVLVGLLLVLASVTLAGRLWS